ncbi:hypothetical protein HMPREF9093_02134 [Fusobacterium sp. oral taxon 370 str. F0437]|uniref:hypothetical protein n=1 Tax=unclassified Fusobacterium TaxID=2648384 RepID=UPI000234A534|nr:hypothetical protein [Fusobacterium sp. oral taxon 370]EHI76242.1 hypothetical protein HMPREF9093_02134 [Fusobacterium sp. oral taxon 370 str. F0437]
MNKFLNPDLSEFKKLEKERVIKELEKAIQKAEAEERRSDVEKLKKELKDLTHESLLDKFKKNSVMY